MEDEDTAKKCWRFFNERLNSFFGLEFSSDVNGGEWWWMVVDDGGKGRMWGNNVENCWRLTLGRVVMNGHRWM